MTIGFASDIENTWRETQGAIQCDSKEFDAVIEDYIKLKQR